jgi:hypothetical protein
MKLGSMKAVSLIIVFSLVASSAAIAGKTPAGKADQSLRRGETRATLDPASFSDPTVKEAYRIAKEIPWVLDSIYCYCMCEESPAFKHKSLLSCYVDNHAAV